MSNIIGCICNFISQVFPAVKAIQNREVGWLTVDRRTGEFKREKQSLWKKFKLLLLFNRLTEWIDRTHLLRLWTHEKNLAAGLHSLTPYPVDISNREQGRRRLPASLIIRSSPSSTSTKLT